MSIFDSIAVRRKPESVFDLSHRITLSGNMAELLPIYLEEILPGDTFRVKSQILMRVAPMLAPIYHNVNVYVHYFYVPNRLVWDNWHDHITGGEDGLANPAHPYLSISDANKAFFNKGELADYLGLPIVDQAAVFGNAVNVSSLPFRGYQTIFNEYYRDQDLSVKIPVPTGDGDDNASIANLGNLRKRSWQRDYFTSARPDAQKGAAVTIPAQAVYKNPADLVLADNSTPVPTGQQMYSTGGQSTFGVDQPTSVGGTIRNIEAISTTVEDQRRANRLQEWLELAQRGGSRINEIIRNFFDVTPDDLRITRPQYLGGGVQPIVMSEVLNTAGDAGAGTLQPVGEYAGHGISVGSSNQFTKAFKEHGYVFGIMSVLPKPSYQSQGIHRHWTKFDKFEKYWPQFANIGEQEILNQEIYISPADTIEERQETFGYIPRYSEYKYACDRVAGEMRQESADASGLNLSFWHMARWFENRPTLNQEFVEADPTQRIYANTDASVDKLFIDVRHRIKAKRKMPYHNNPSNMPVV